jgi:hypothetical protein
VALSSCPSCVFVLTKSCLVFFTLELGATGCAIHISYSPVMYKNILWCLHNVKSTKDSSENVSLSLSYRWLARITAGCWKHSHPSLQGWMDLQRMVSQKQSGMKTLLPSCLLLTAPLHRCLPLAEPSQKQDDWRRSLQGLASDGSKHRLLHGHFSCTVSQVPKLRRALCLD